MGPRCWKRGGHTLLHVLSRVLRKMKVEGEWGGLRTVLGGLSTSALNRSLSRPPPKWKMPSESSPRLPLAYETGSPLTAMDRSSDVLQSRTRLVFLNSVPHPERDIYLRLQIHDYTDPSVPAEVEAQAKPALGSRGCKVIKQKTGAVPDGLSRTALTVCAKRHNGAGASVGPELRQLTGPDYNSQTPPRASSGSSRRHSSCWPRS